MAVRTTVDIPEPLHDCLRQRSRQSGVSIRSLIMWALEQAYLPAKKPEYVTGALVKCRGTLGPRFPRDKNPHAPIGDCFLLAFSKGCQSTLVSFDRALVNHAVRRGYAAIRPVSA